MFLLAECLFPLASSYRVGAPIPHAALIALMPPIPLTECSLNAHALQKHLLVVDDSAPLHPERSTCIMVDLFGTTKGPAESNERPSVPFFPLFFFFFDACSPPSCHNSCKLSLTPIICPVPACSRVHVLCLCSVILVRVLAVCV